MAQRRDQVMRDELPPQEYRVRECAARLLDEIRLLLPGHVGPPADRARAVPNLGFPFAHPSFSDRARHEEARDPQNPERQPKRKRIGASLAHGYLVGFKARDRRGVMS
jgi:hypothetical protein